jgi:RNA recognition motif-containing protein
MPRRRDGRRRGIAFVEFKSAALAKKALLKHGMMLMGRRINIRHGGCYLKPKLNPNTGDFDGKAHQHPTW